MSLINDALRRTKQSQQQAPPSAPPCPQLQPLEAVVLPPPNRRLMRLGVAGAAALVGLLLIWQATRSHQPASAGATMPAAPGQEIPHRTFRAPPRPRRPCNPPLRPVNLHPPPAAERSRRQMRPLRTSSSSQDRPQPPTPCQRHRLKSPRRRRPPFGCRQSSSTRHARRP